MLARLRLALLAGVFALGHAVSAMPETVTTQAGLLAREGGVYEDRGLRGYVAKIGSRVAASAGLQPFAWSFQVLDTPEANAFALPGGQIFVTRGMLALVGDEAELAVVLGHEIGHAVAGHGLAGRGQASDRARRAAEFEADHLGMGYLVAAGYDSAAQADFLATLAASQALEARLRGATPVEGAGDHPAIADRLRAARSEAAALGGHGVRNRDAYLAAIDGITWGDGPAQGYVRGRTFLHPRLGFAFDAPAGYVVENQPDAVVASGPRGAVFLLDSLPDPGVSADAYMVRSWIPEIGQGVGTGPIEDLRRIRQHGLSGARGRVDLAGRDSRRVADLTVIRLAGRFYRLTGLHAPADRVADAALTGAAASFRPLSAREAARARPLRIRIHRVARGENVAVLVRAMPIAAAEKRFDLMNGLLPGTDLRVGDPVKLVTE